jgi:hypothetical protein
MTGSQLVLAGDKQGAEEPAGALTGAFPVARRHADSCVLQPAQRSLQEPAALVGRRFVSGGEFNANQRLRAGAAMAFQEGHAALTTPFRRQRLQAAPAPRAALEQFSPVRWGPGQGQLQRDFPQLFRANSLTHGASRLQRSTHGGESRRSNRG